MKKYFSSIGLIIAAMAIFFGCRLEEESISTDMSLGISFSVDSVLFDTVLVGRKSYSERLIVRNGNENALRFSSIRLASEENSQFTMFINGQEGKTFEDEIIYGGDSMLVLINTVIEPEDIDSAFEVIEPILFDFNGNTEEIVIRTFGLDFNDVADTLECNTVWTAERPYLVSRDIVIAENCMLTIEKGVRVFMGYNTSINVDGTLKIRGDSTDFVQITNDIFDSGFRRVPGQWGDIRFNTTSTGNEIQYAEIRNGSNGLFFFLKDRTNLEPDIIVENTEIKNMLGAGVIGAKMNIQMRNCAVSNCAGNLFGMYSGGTAVLHNNTFSNETTDFFRNAEIPSFLLTNDLVLGGVQVKGFLTVELKDNIIWSGEEEPFLLDELRNEPNTIVIENNIIKSSSNEFSENNITGDGNNFPGFVSLVSRNFELDSTSIAVDKGSNASLEIDFFGRKRDGNADIGAYEWFPAPDTTEMNMN